MDTDPEPEPAFELTDETPATPVIPRSTLARHRVPPVRRSVISAPTDAGPKGQHMAFLITHFYEGGTAVQYRAVVDAFFGA
jgi:hypothetical protein